MNAMNHCIPGDTSYLVWWLDNDYDTVLLTIERKFPVICKGFLLQHAMQSSLA